MSCLWALGPRRTGTCLKRRHGTFTCPPRRGPGFGNFDREEEVVLSESGGLAGRVVESPPTGSRRRRCRIGWFLGTSRSTGGFRVLTPTLQANSCEPGCRSSPRVRCSVVQRRSGSCSGGSIRTSRQGSPRCSNKGRASTAEYLRESRGHEETESCVPDVLSPSYPSPVSESLGPGADECPQ